MGSDMTGTIMEMDYDTLDREIKRSMRRSAGEVVRLGYMLRRMKEEGLWAGHYPSMDEYLGKELHMEKTMASRFMAINRRFSVDGGSTEIDARYRDYSQSLLVEMLGMPPKLAEKITPGMTARQAREIRREAREESMDGACTDGGIQGQTDLETDFPEWLPEGYQAGVVPVEGEAAGMPCLAAGSGEETTEPQSRETGSPEGARTWEEGEAAEAATPQQPELAKPDEKAYQYLDDFARRFIRSRHDWLGEDHGSRVDDVTKSPGEIRGHLGENGRTWYFPSGKDSAAHINLFDGYVQLFDGTGIHLGDFDWFYVAAAIQRMWNVVSREMAGEGRTGTVDPAGAGSREAETREEPEARYTDPGEEVAMSQQEPDEDPGDGLRGIKSLLEEESRKLDSYLEVSAVEGIPEKLLFRQKTIVAALAAMVCDLENAAPGEERSQPPLPLLKNNDQRKDWLKDYRAWGLWYRDTNIGVDYYKYDFENGARLVAEVYAEHGEYTGDYEYCTFHLAGGPEPPKAGHGCGKWTRHDRYSRYPNSETELVEFLKYTQGKGMGG